MQNKFGETNKLLMQEREAEQETSEETLHPINTISAPNGDAENIVFLTKEVEGLKNLLESEKQKVLEYEQICKEAEEFNEKRCVKLEATEEKVDQLQETFGRMIQYFSNQVSELKMILGTSSSSISTTRPNGLYDQVDAKPSGTTFTNPVPTPITVLAPDALRQIVLDLSPPAQSSGCTIMERGREVVFDDFF